MTECERCGETVYAADRAESSTGVYHKTCFLCEICKCKLNAAILREKDGQNYCNRCVSKAASSAAKPVSPAAKTTTVIHAAPQTPAWLSASAGGIGTRVVASEDSALDDDYAEATTPAVATPAPRPPQGTSSQSTPAPIKLTPPAAGPEQPPAKGNSAKALAAKFGAMAVSSPVPAPAPSPAPRQAPSTPVPLPSPAASAGASSAPGPVAPTSRPAAKPQGKVPTIGQIIGGTAACPRCGKAVYMAEKVIGPGGDWHKSCLACIECKKTLTSSNLAEHKGEAYCKSCHDKAFGPKGYGFSQGGAGVMRAS